MMLHGRWPVAIQLLDGAHDALFPRLLALLLQLSDILQGYLVLAQGRDAFEQEAAAAARRAALPAQLRGERVRVGYGDWVCTWGWVCA